jgi:hypothetical protein
MADSPVSLSRSALARVAGLAIGIVALKPDAAAPAARLVITDTTTGGSVRATVSPGDHLTVGIRTMHVTGIVCGDDGHVDLTVSDGESDHSGEMG